MYDSPPTLWPKQDQRIKMGADLVRAECDLRLYTMAKQIEKLSWMVQIGAEDLHEVMNIPVDSILEELELSWQHGRLNLSTQ